MERTADPHVLIEERREGYIRYVRDDGRRWEVRGTCDLRGDCLVGAVDPLLGPPEGRLDVPVTPEFDSCCGSDIFTYVELPSGVTR